MSAPLLPRTLLSRAVLSLALLCAPVWVACSTPTQSTAVAASPAEIEDAECAVCAMMVREQPAPHAQVVHRDGTRAFTCSIGDLRAYLAAPSPHGKVQQIWVQALADDYDPAGTSPIGGPWVLAADAHYVVGVTRPTVMGRPVLAYATPAQATAAAKATGGHVVTWQALRDTPFSQDPP
ncbi:MAG: hypothetical protein GXP62_00550 [Oligoflexia bacterium]|nr:hypothetical protein [Oligoflexia bacterium]